MFVFSYLQPRPPVQNAGERPRYALRACESANGVVKPWDSNSYNSDYIPIYSADLVCISYIYGTETRERTCHCGRWSGLPSAPTTTPENRIYPDLSGSKRPRLRTARHTPKRRMTHTIAIASKQGAARKPQARIVI